VRQVRTTQKDATKPLVVVVVVVVVVVSFGR